MILLQVPDAPVALPDSVPSVHEELSMLKSMPIDEFINRVVNSIVSLAINLAIAVLVFYCGRFIINKLYNLILGIFIRRKVDRSLSTFILSMVRIVLYFVLIVTVIGIIGIETSSFLAIFASAGVAIGMALSGTLQNFAGGVLILLLKPYKIGDYIEAQGYTGTVREIQIFHTIISTPDNKSIIIPNGGLSTGSINNYSREAYRRVDWMLSISYGDKVESARSAILAILASDPRVVDTTIANHEASLHPEASAQATEEKKPKGAEVGSVGAPTPLNAPAVKLAELAASSIDLKITAWVRTEDYWGVFYDINERLYNELPAAGINFPFPQMDVHIQQ
ncbi:MAG: mechanosensitive ion channel [Muribaculaceae bacterium]|nr:mechanosensitive ion channel [Muribaculaceae bacterium]